MFSTFQRRRKDQLPLSQTCPHRNFGERVDPSRLGALLGEVQAGQPSQRAGFYQQSLHLAHAARIPDIYGCAPWEMQENLCRSMGSWFGCVLYMNPSPFVVHQSHRSVLQTYSVAQRSGKVPGFEDHRLSDDCPRARTFDFRFLAASENSFIIDVKENGACLEV